MAIGYNTDEVELVVGREYDWNQRWLSNEDTRRIMSRLVVNTKIVLRGISRSRFSVDVDVVDITTGRLLEQTNLASSWLVPRPTYFVQVAVDSLGNFSESELSNEDLEIIRGYLNAR